MKLDEAVAWYQKKIGTYDKQQWEKTVEQKILDGFRNVNLKTAKLKTEFIDVDLVRGSTFPKAKSKQSLLTVIRLAILRYFFLPIYTKWWVRQTSANVFGLLLLLYIIQMVNWAVFTFHTNNHHPAHNASSSTTDESAKEHMVSLSELLIPMGLSLLLSLIHSQIVATNIATGSKSKRRRFSNTSHNTKNQKTGEARMRKRRKLVKARCQEFADNSTQQRKPSCSVKNIHFGMEAMTKLYKSVPIECKSTTEDTECVHMQRSCSPATLTGISNINPYYKETFHTTSAIRSASSQSPSTLSQPSTPLPPLILPIKLCHIDLNDPATLSGIISTENISSDNQRKRNVNWNSPIHNYAAEEQLETLVSPQSLDTSSEKSAPDFANVPLPLSLPPVVSSENVVNESPNKTVRIDESVQEFYDDLISRAEVCSSADATLSNAGNVASPRRNIGEDDGFESLNGKSSSGEETNFSTISTNRIVKNQLRLRLNVPTTEAVAYRSKVALSSESEENWKQKSSTQPPLSCDAYQQTSALSLTRTSGANSEETEEEGDDGDIISSPNSLGGNANYNECTTSATEWLGVTTNSEECSYSSELDNSDNYKNAHLSDEEGYDIDFTPTTILNAQGSSDRISCTFWEQREFKKAQMSVLQISSCIIERVESMPETKDYIYIGQCFSFLLSLIPPFCRLCEVTIDSDKSGELNFFDVPLLLWEKVSFSFSNTLALAFGNTRYERIILALSFMQRLCLTSILFIVFAVAERTFKQRFLYAKLFSHLTSSRRARKSNLPHFRLNKVLNIKTWLSVRSYLKKRGPQRSVDVIVSAAFIVTLLLLAFLSVEWLKDSVSLHSHLNLEALLWSTTIGIFLLRFMTLGNKIHQKYRSISVLITEQINLYLQIEQKPKKKEELMVSNSVLKLAADLLKELETPFKISGLSANPYLFTTIKVVILSALSGVLSEMLGFKLKLHKIKIK